MGGWRKKGLALHEDRIEVGAAAAMSDGRALDITVSVGRFVGSMGATLLAAGS